LTARLFERESGQRFQIASSPESSQQLDTILYAPDGVVTKYGLDGVHAVALRDQLLQGLIVHLYSVAVGLRVSERLTLDYPELLELESEHIQRELNMNHAGLADKVRETLPREVYDATHKINTAYALYWSRHLEKPEVVNPYRLQGFESAGNDYELVDAWAESLGIRGWFVWVKYE